MDIVVHRGANDLAPENTMAAARACENLGVEFVEIDVWRSLDGVHYIMHDPKLDRTTTGSGFIGRRRSGYIDKLDAGSWFSSEFAGEPVPRLEEFLDWARGRIGVYLDVKTGSLKQIVQMIRDREMSESVFFWFWSDRRARKFRRLAPDLSLKMNSKNPDMVRKHKAEFDHQIVEQGPGDGSAAVIRTCRELGIRTMANISGGKDKPDDGREALYSQIVELGYDMVNLDRPAPFVEFLKKEGLR